MCFCPKPTTKYTPLFKIRGEKKKHPEECWSIALEVWSVLSHYPLVALITDIFQNKQGFRIFSLFSFSLILSAAGSQLVATGRSFEIVDPSRRTLPLLSHCLLLLHRNLAMHGECFETSFSELH